jgi:acetoin utilization deacetylase AcuC-like enzyme
MATAYVYHPIYLEHDWPGHPEAPRRLERIIATLDKHGVLGRLELLAPHAVTREALLRVHSERHVKHVQHVAERGGGYLDPDTYVSPRSFEAALMASGGLVRAVEAVLADEVANAFALVRPPGHHATAERAMGFCLFNNVAIAALAALAEHPMERIFVADFDVHHGNGTQDILGDNPDAFFFSTHQYPYYPGTGARTEIGRGAGRGTVLNVPLPPRVGDNGYAHVYEELVWPLAERFAPDLMLVSAGYDGHWDDPLAHMSLSLGGYASIQRELVKMADRLCGGRIVFTLEGGYHLEALAYGVLNAVHALLGEEDTVVDPLGPSPRAEPSIDALIQDLRALHQLN